MNIPQQAWKDYARNAEHKESDLIPKQAFFAGFVSACVAFNCEAQNNNGVVDVAALHAQGFKFFTDRINNAKSNTKTNEEKQCQHTGSLR